MLNKIEIVFCFLFFYLFPSLINFKIVGYNKLKINIKACSDKNGTCLISTPDIQIEKIVKSLGLEMPNLTTIDKIDKFKNQCLL